MMSVPILITMASLTPPPAAPPAPVAETPATTAATGPSRGSLRWRGNRGSTTAEDAGDYRPPAGAEYWDDPPPLAAPPPSVANADRAAQQRFERRAREGAECFAARTLGERRPTCPS